MAKQIYNYELFTNKKDELAKIRKKAARNRRIKILLLALILAGTAIVAIFFLIANATIIHIKIKLIQRTAVMYLTKTLMKDI
ncbi:hypothetical protein DW068_06830 [Anaerobutyricum hallii]|uniref:Uncharacterized protein n=1 Tax=Anaerobutyricum hallii TaxID=39488 RepID=A0A415G7S6_9FIRM|nr:hypothetical protein [Anaerobutyricum hallii]RHK39687.1 hypothetical protein DW068_06830 [Anaerobutyricum hallii]